MVATASRWRFSAAASATARCPGAGRRSRDRPSCSGLAMAARPAGEQQMHHFARLPLLLLVPALPLAARQREGPIERLRGRIKRGIDRLPG